MDVVVDRTTPPSPSSLQTRTLLTSWPLGWTPDVAANTNAPKKHHLRRLEKPEETVSWGVGWRLKWWSKLVDWGGGWRLKAACRRVEEDEASRGAAQRWEREKDINLGIKLKPSKIIGEGGKSKIYPGRQKCLIFSFGWYFVGKHKQISDKILKNIKYSFSAFEFRRKTLNRKHEINKGILKKIHFVTISSESFDNFPTKSIKTYFFSLLML